MRKHRIMKPPPYRLQVIVTIILLVLAPAAWAQTIRVPLPDGTAWSGDASDVVRVRWRGGPDGEPRPG